MAHIFGKGFSVQENLANYEIQVTICMFFKLYIWEMFMLGTQPSSVGIDVE